MTTKQPYDVILAELSSLFRQYESARCDVKGAPPYMSIRMHNGILSQQTVRYAREHWLDIMESALSNLRFQIMQASKGTFVESDVWDWTYNQREADAKLIQRLRQEQEIEQKEKPDPADPDNYKPEA